MAGKRALVVDDEKLIVKGIRFSLEQDDMQVDCAYDGEEALEYARNNQYDIILLDIMLPKLTGFEVCQQIREFSTVPIIMLTAKGDEHRALPAGYAPGSLRRGVGTGAPRRPAGASAELSGRGNPGAADPHLRGKWGWSGSP